MGQTYAPREIVQNTRQEWTFSCSDYPASAGYTATFTLVSAAGSLSVDAATNTNGADYDFTLTKAQTAALYAGGFQYQTSVSDGTNRYVIESGFLLVLPDLDTTQPLGVDGRSSARKRFDAYTALLTNEAYIKTMGPEQIAALEDTVRRLEGALRREDEAEREKRAEPHSRKIFARLV